MGKTKLSGKKQFTDEDWEQLVEQVRCNSISTASKLEIMAQAVAPCPEVTFKTKGSTFKGLLDFGSMVTLIIESFFQSNLAKSITPMTGDKVNAHQLFNLKRIEDEQVPLSIYFEMDVEICGFRIPQFGFLVKRDNAPLVDSKGKKTKLSAIAGCNLIRLGMEEFIKVHGYEPLNLFKCPTGFDPLLFSTFCIYYYTEREREKEEVSNEEDKVHIGINSMGVGDAHGNSNKKAREGTLTSKIKGGPKNEGYLEGYAGMVTIGEKHKPFCITANASHNVMGRAKGLPYHGDFMVELAEDNNLLARLVVNRTYVHPIKSNLVPVTLIKTNDYNVWIRQPLFAAELYEVEEQQCEHETVFVHEDGSNDIKVHFQPVPPADIREEIFTQSTQQTEDLNGKSIEKEEPLPKFGPRPNFDGPNFDFKAELSWGGPSQ